MRRLGVLLVAGCIALVGHEAGAKKKKPPQEQHVVALFLVAKGKPDPKIYAAFADELAKAPASLPALHLLSGKPLKKRIKANPEVAIARCGSDVECVAKLGAKARAAEVAYGRVVPSDTGVKIQFLIVNVASASIDRKVALDLTSVDSVTEVRGQYAELFGKGATAAPPAVAGAGEGSEGGGDEELSLDLIEDTSLAKQDEAASAASAAPGLESPPGETAPEVAAAPLAESEPVDDDPLAATPAALPDVAAVSPPASSEGGATAGSGAPVMFYAGVGLAGVGVATLGAAAFFGNKSKSLRNELGSDTTQLEGKELESDANRAATRANLLLGISGVALAAGAGLIVFDLMSAKSEGTGEVVVGATPAGAFLKWSW